MLYCSQCGAPNREGARFCNICGTRLEAAPAAVSDAGVQPADAAGPGAAPPVEPVDLLAAEPAGSLPGEEAAEGAQDEGGVEPAPQPAEELQLPVEEAPGEMQADEQAPVAAEPVAAEVPAFEGMDAEPAMQPAGIAGFDGGRAGLDAAWEPAPFEPEAAAAPVPDLIAEAVLVEIDALEHETEQEAAPEEAPPALADEAPVLADEAPALADEAHAPADEAPAPVDEAPAPVEQVLVEFVEGTALDGRYWVVETLLSETVGASSYIVEDRSRCPVCGGPVQPAPDQAYCDSCGKHLLADDIEWPRWLAVPVSSSDQAAQGPAEPGSEQWMTVTHDGVTLLLQPLAALEQAAPPPAAPARTFPKGVTLLVGQRSDVGLARAGNPDEDSLFALTLSLITDSRAAPAVGLFFVADGMGGHGDGELASRIAAETISTLLTQSLVLPALQGQRLADQQIAALIDAAIQAANQRILEQAARLGSNMGTTLTLAFVLDSAAYIANVGDSRTYLWGAGGLRAITEDHSVVYALWKAGEITEQELYDHPMRSGITRSLGQPGEVPVDFFLEPLAPGDILLLCCDGLWEMIRSEGIADVLMMGLDNPQAICDELISRANLAGGEDNVSVLVMRALA